MKFFQSETAPRRSEARRGGLVGSRTAQISSPQQRRWQGKPSAAGTTSPASGICRGDMADAHPQTVRICCRVRPALPSESTRCCTEITSRNGTRMIQLNDPRNARESMTYQFDE